MEDKEKELEKLEARSVGRHSVAGLSMRNVLNNANPLAKPQTKRHNPSRKQEVSETESVDKNSMKSHTYKKQNSRKELHGADKLVGTDTKAQDYKELLKQEETRHVSITHTEAEKSLIA